MHNDYEGFAESGARQRLRFDVTGGDADLLSLWGSGSEADETAAAVARKIKHLLIAKGENRLRPSRVQFIERHRAWAQFLRREWSNIPASILVFADPTVDTPRFWVLAPDRGRGWDARVVPIENLPEVTGATQRFLGVARASARRSGESAARRRAAKLAREWSETGLPLEEQVEWAEAVTHASEMAQWKALGFGAESARSWRSCGFGAATSHDWNTRSIGPRWAKEWDAFGFSPEGALLWIGQNVPPRPARILRDAGLEPSYGGEWFDVLKDSRLVLRWIQQGLTVEAARRWGVLQPGRVARMLDGTVKPSKKELLALESAGVSPPVSSAPNSDRSSTNLGAEALVSTSGENFRDASQPPTDALGSFESLHRREPSAEGISAVDNACPESFAAGSVVVDDTSCPPEVEAVVDSLGIDNDSSPERDRDSHGDASAVDEDLDGAVALGCATGLEVLLAAESAAKVKLQNQLADMSAELGLTEKRLEVALRRVSELEFLMTSGNENAARLYQRLGLVQMELAVAVENARVLERQLVESEREADRVRSSLRAEVSELGTRLGRIESALPRRYRRRFFGGDS